MLAIVDLGREQIIEDKRYTELSCFDINPFVYLYINTLSKVEESLGLCFGNEKASWSKVADEASRV